VEADRAAAERQRLTLLAQQASATSQSHAHTPQKILVKTLPNQGATAVPANKSPLIPAAKATPVLVEKGPPISVEQETSIPVENAPPIPVEIRLVSQPAIADPAKKHMATLAGIPNAEKMAEKLTEKPVTDDLLAKAEAKPKRSPSGELAAASKAGAFLV
jgi:hypothetical protein